MKFCVGLNAIASVYCGRHGDITASLMTFDDGAPSWATNINHLRVIKFVLEQNKTRDEEALDGRLTD